MIISLESNGYVKDVMVTLEDFVDFLMPSEGNHWGSEALVAFHIACERVWNSEWLDYDYIENDAEFVAYLTEKYM